MELARCLPFPPALYSAQVRSISQEEHPHPPLCPGQLGIRAHAESCMDQTYATSIQRWHPCRGVRVGRNALYFGQSAGRLAPGSWCVVLGEEPSLQSCVSVSDTTGHMCLMCTLAKMAREGQFSFCWCVCFVYAFCFNCLFLGCSLRDFYNAGQFWVV